jgi:hypothetical protein
MADVEPIRRALAALSKELEQLPPEAATRIRARLRTLAKAFQAAGGTVPTEGRRRNVMDPDWINNLK